jgi:hypothetical protein
MLVKPHGLQLAAGYIGTRLILCRRSGQQFRAANAQRAGELIDRFLARSLRRAKLQFGERRFSQAGTGCQRLACHANVLPPCPQMWHGYVTTLIHYRYVESPSLFLPIIMHLTLPWLKA